MTSDPSLIPEPFNKSADRPYSSSGEIIDLERRVAELQQQEKALRQEIAALQASHSNLLQKQVAETQTAIGRVVKEGLSELEQRRQTLQVAVDQLERRQERIRNEMKTTFAGASQDLAIRVQGFKDYLVGSLQDLVTAAEQLQMAPPEPQRPESQRSSNASSPPAPGRSAESRLAESNRAESNRDSANRAEAAPKFAESGFQEQGSRIRKLLDQYRLSPDYYGAPWHLRRTFEPIHAERVSNWFFTQGGRGALKSMGSRLQNILIASATISILKELYGDRLRVLVLGNSPERLGEWRRGLQDCLGVSRPDFGADQGIMLFEAPEPLVQRADRLVKQRQMPLVIVDESEIVVDIALLQFPLWLAFAADPANPAI
ncbi:MAG: DUF3086 domain-containing protein [Drouetiella hepatica Uher 2000/2452]|jgi:chaperonin cofactor prefoldin|uniref:DUF3086 domain-containing protein n=1 Tax=Drouetiella hepatica Uher 2000/2452 TaxID=904376 RepID=A0A951QD09_9CYAN|nr:DUF3086 domain-containing protein [Drouetiella hepatica Uher 2000/2452]